MFKKIRPDLGKTEESDACIPVTNGPAAKSSVACNAIYSTLVQLLQGLLMSFTIFTSWAFWN